MRRAWMTFLAWIPLSVLGCNLVVGIEEVTEGTACTQVAECPSAEETCTVASCDIGVCAVVTAADGTACGQPGETCTAGACSCPAEHRCGTEEACTDLDNDPRHCGACDRVCGSGEECVAAACVCPDRNQCGDACIDTLVTSSDCGECGHDCGGAACHGGVCEPEVVADGVGAVVAMTVDGDDVLYASETGAIGRVSLSDLVPQTLASAGPFGPYGIAADETTAYFTSLHPDYDGLFAVPRNGGDPTPLAAPEANPGLLQRVGSTLLFVSADGIRAFALPNGPATTLVAVPGIKSFDADEQEVFYTVADRVEHGPIGGGPTAVLASGLVAPSAIAIDTNAVYVVSAASSEDIAAGNAAGAIVRIDRASGQAETIASSLTDPRSVAVDAGYVYFTDHTVLGVFRFDEAGGHPLPFASGIDPSARVVFAGSSVLVADATHGRILRIAR